MSAELNLEKIKDKLKITAVIMAGGSGTRLWPLSRSKRPKQFLSINDKDTLLQLTVKRLTYLNVESSIVICNEEHRFLAAEQLKEIDSLCPIILEPEGKNTAPAIALSAFESEKDTILLVLSADHIIEDEKEFKKSFDIALFHAIDDKLVTFGIEPTAAHTGYGYIKKGDFIKDGYKVDSFTEKPQLDVAKKYFESGDYFWNSGIFMFKAGKYLNELSKYRSDIYDSCRQSINNKSKDLDFIRIDKKFFASCPSDSVDYAVMENTEDAIVVEMDAGWSDIGSWKSLHEVSKKDQSGNVKLGDVISFDTKDSFIQSQDQLVATIGVENLIIVATKDVVMIVDKNSTEKVKVLTDELKSKSRPELDLHREVYRPWGKYDSIDQGDTFQVKRITVKPGEKLSVQKHHYRSEHWVVISGTAIVTKDGETSTLKKNESVYIPLGCIHALENPGLTPLELIEVQSGDYLGEDDIVRFEDRYNRDKA